MSPEFFAIFNAATFFTGAILLYMARTEEKTDAAGVGIIAWMLLLIITGCFVHVP